MLPTIIDIVIPGINDSPIRHDVSDYGTIAFRRDFMNRHIGLGQAVVADNGEFRGFDRRSNPGMLNLSVWLAFVPVAYREDVEYAAMYPLWDKFMRQKADQWLIPRYVDALLEWILTHIEPTSEHFPRSVRFARAWFELGVMAAHDQGRITHAEADSLMRNHRG